MITTDKLILGSSLITTTGDNLYFGGGRIPTSFSKTAVVYNSAGISNGVYNIPIWRSTLNCIATGVAAYLVSGVPTGQFNIIKNKTSNLLISNLPVNGTTGSWVTSGIIQNSSFVPGDTLEAKIISISGSPVSVTLQVDFLT